MRAGDEVRAARPEQLAFVVDGYGPLLDALGVELEQLVPQRVLVDALGVPGAEVVHDRAREGHDEVGCNGH